MNISKGHYCGWEVRLTKRPEYPTDYENQIKIAKVWFYDQNATKDLETVTMDRNDVRYFVRIDDAMAWVRKKLEEGE